MSIDTEDRYSDLAWAVVARIPAVLLEVRERLAEGQPEYAAFLDEAYEEVVAAAPAFVLRLVEEARTEQPASAGIEQSVFEEIGRAHRRDGREVTDLVAAYHTGASVLWRVVSEVAVELEVSVEVCSRLAGVVFAAIGRLSAHSLHGYMAEQADTPAVRERAQEELARLLLSDRSDREALERAANIAHWPLPRRAAVVLADPDNDVAREVMAHLPHGTLHTQQANARVAIVPDPDGPGQRHRIDVLLRGAGTAVSVGVPVEGLPTALRLTARSLRIGRAYGITDDPMFVDEHLDTILVHQDDELLATLRSRCLSPLAGLSSPTRERLSRTLLSWLRQMGDRKAVAAELHVHPQTVSYRVGRLRELFGPALDQADVRVNLLLSLAWDPATASDDRGPRNGPPYPAEPGRSGAAPSRNAPDSG